MDRLEEIALLDLAIEGLYFRLDHYKNRLAFLNNEQPEMDRFPREKVYNGKRGRPIGSKNKPKPSAPVGTPLENPAGEKI